MKKRLFPLADFRLDIDRDVKAEWMEIPSHDESIGLVGMFTTTMNTWNPNFPSIFEGFSPPKTRPKFQSKQGAPFGFQVVDVYGKLVGKYHPGCKGWVYHVWYLKYLLFWVVN